MTPQFGAVMEDEKYFPNANEFNPQRFIDDPSLAEKVRLHDISVAYCTLQVMPFSLGKRQCLGESLARMEIFLVFVTIMQKYRCFYQTFFFVI